MSRKTITSTRRNRLRRRTSQTRIEALEPRALFAAGALDPTFLGSGVGLPDGSSPGLLRQDVSGLGDSVQQIIVLPNDIILAGGNALEAADGSSSNIALSEYGPDGSAVFGWSAPAIAPPLADGIAIFKSMAVLHSSEIVVAGAVAGGTKNPPPGELLRYGANGIFEGSITLDFTPVACFAIPAQGLQPDEVMIIGNGSNGIVTGLYQAPLLPGPAIFTPDPNFGEVVLHGTLNGGPFPNNLSVTAAVRESGNSGSMFASVNSFATGPGLIKLTPGGVIDPLFGQDQIVPVPAPTGAPLFNNPQPSLSLDGENRILVALGNQISRFNQDGSPDGSFGAGGTAAAPGIEFRAATTAPDGSVIGVGAPPNADGFLAARFSNEGILDNSFGAGGVASIAVGTDLLDVSAVAVQSTGRILMAGNISDAGANVQGEDFAVARLLKDNQTPAPGPGPIPTPTPTPTPTPIPASNILPSVAKSTLPPSVIGGAAIHASVTVNLANHAATLLKGLAIVRLYASTNDMVDNAATLVAATTRRVSLKPNKTLSLQVPIRSLPASLADGTYTLLAQVTDPSGNVGTATTGPILRVAAPFIDLAAAFTPPTLPPSGLRSTKTAAVGISLTNRGNISASGSIVLTVYTSSTGQLDGSQTALPGFRPFRVHLKPGKSQAIRLRVKLPTGTYFLVGVLGDSSLSPSDSDANDKTFVTASAVTVS